MAGAWGAGHKQRVDGATPERCTRFLEGLAETGHVGRSALLAGKKGAHIFYYRRKTNPEFAAQWDEAIAAGIARIEAGLVERGLAAIEAQEAEGGEGLRPLDFQELMTLLKYYRTAPPGGVKHGPKRRYASREETDAALLARLDVLEARVKARLAKEAAARRAARMERRRCRDTAGTG